MMPSIYCYIKQLCTHKLSSHVSSSSPLSGSTQAIKNANLSGREKIRSISSTSESENMSAGQGTMQGGGFWSKAGFVLIILRLPSWLPTQLRTNKVFAITMTPTGPSNTMHLLSLQFCSEVMKYGERNIDCMIHMWTYSYIGCKNLNSHPKIQASIRFVTLKQKC